MARILVADDDVPIANLIAFKLQNEGHKVTIANDGAAALASAYMEHPDIIVLDLMMPVLTGMEVMAQLREDPINRRIPVIVLSARTSEDDIVAGFAAGAVDYVTKPFSIRELSARIVNALRRGPNAGGPPSVAPRVVLDQDTGTT